jgi:hypothetical protein
MKYRAFIAISLLLGVSSPKTLACGPWYFEPSEYYMFRISDNYLTGSTYRQGFNYGAEENCLLWQRQTSIDIPVSHIYSVVYGKNATSDWIEDLLYHKRSRWILSVDEEENRFCRWLWKDEEATEFLLLAKQCEETRDKMASPWYYPSKKDPDKMSLEQIVERADEYEGKRFIDRYLLQTERALFSLHKYDECINRWNDMCSSLPDNIIRRLTLRYVAGAYYNIGDVDTAMKLFGEAGDVASVLCCARGKGEDHLTAMYEYTPSSRELREEVELIVLAAEREIWDWGWSAPSDYCPTIEEDTRTKLEHVRALAIRIADEGKVDDPDLWYYTAAFIDHLLGRNSDASWLLRKAETSRGSEFIKESVRVLKLYLDALGPYNSSYDYKMLDGVKWLESKVIEHLDEGRAATISCGMYYTGINLSYFYWNDMLRKIVHAGIVPRLLKSNKEALAIAYSNMADNLVFNLVGEVDSSWSSSQRMSLDDYRKEGAFNSLDYSNMTFGLLDSIKVESIIEYVDNLDKPESGTYRYLNSKGYTDADYFSDIIGTRLIRDMRYSEAEVWLAKVSPSFQKQLNTFRDGYLSFDPFAQERTRMRNRADVKYDFAREMASLEKAIGQTRDPDRKAILMARFATGMKNSVGDCWALAFYGLSSSEYDEEYGANSLFARAQKKGFDRAEKLYASALSICLDKETAAQINLSLGNCKTVVKKFKTTQAAEYVRGHCDTYADYHLERKENFWRH